MQIGSRFVATHECDASEEFKKAATETLDATQIVIGTITLGGDDFIHRIKVRKDIEIMEVTVDNRDSIPDIILERISFLYGNKMG